jgi:hypothetical protein
MKSTISFSGKTLPCFEIQQASQAGDLARCLSERRLLHSDCTVKVKGKSVPLQAWSGPEGSRKLRFQDFMTTAQGGGKFVSHTHRPHLPPGNSTGTHFC